VQLTIQKNVELANIYEAYEQKMADLRFYDYGDMILCVQEVLEQNEDFRQIVQESYQYILVDEHQDTNQSQNSIIDILVSFFIDSPNLFVVGDDKQGVYRFQGASVLNFTDFVRKYPKTKVINLVENYRSDASILAYAESILSGREPLRSQTKNFPKINVYE
jgi:DNA helicase-2/ATP-dependent DNA helicase PcrA